MYICTYVYICVYICIHRLSAVWNVQIYLYMCILFQYLHVYSQTYMYLCMYTYVFIGCGWLAPPKAIFLKKRPVFVRRISLGFQIEGNVHIKTVLIPTSCIFIFYIIFFYYIHVCTQYFQYVITLHVLLLTICIYIYHFLYAIFMHILTIFNMQIHYVWIHIYI